MPCAAQNCAGIPWDLPSRTLRCPPADAALREPSLGSRMALPLLHYEMAPRKRCLLRCLPGHHHPPSPEVPPKTASLTLWEPGHYLQHVPAPGPEAMLCAGQGYPSCQQSCRSGGFLILHRQPTSEKKGKELLSMPEWTWDSWRTQRPVMGQPPRTHQPLVSYSLKECFTPTQGYSAFSEAPPSLSLTRLQEDAVSFNEAGV